MVKKTIVIAVLAAGISLLGGCGMFEKETWKPQENAAISIDEDGRITEIIHEELDASYYDASELQNMLTSEVNDYNGKHGEDSVKVQKFEAENWAVDLEIQYAAAADYAEFNNVEFYYGSMIKAQLEGYLFDVSYKKVQNGVVKGSAVSGSEVIKEMDEQVLIVRAPLEVHIPGDVIYISTNAEVLASDVVNATGQKEEEEEGLVLPSSAVYREEDNASFEEQQAANRVYIIFSME